MRNDALKYLAGLVVLSVVLALALKGFPVHKAEADGFQVHIVPTLTQVLVNERYGLSGRISTPPQRYERRLRICNASRCRTGSWGAITLESPSSVYVGAIAVDQPGVYQAYFTLYEPWLFGAHRAAAQISWAIEAF